MKGTTYLTLFTVIMFLLSCDKRNETQEYYNLFASTYPREVNVMCVATGYCIEGEDQYLTLTSTKDSSSTWNNLCLCIQTSNNAQSEPGNSFIDHYEFFAWSDYASDLDKYKSPPLPEYEDMLSECKTSIKHNMLVSGPQGPLEYRTDLISDIIITADTILFGIESGRDISSYFDIVSFYANTVGYPSLVISENDKNENYLAIKENILLHSDNKIISHECHDSTIVTPFRKKVFDRIPLNEWKNQNPLVDPALYIKLAQIPSERPETVTFYVTLKTVSGKTLEANSGKTVISK
jgi:hypothetical protein